MTEWVEWSDVVASENTAREDWLFLRSGAVEWPELPVPLWFADRRALEKVDVEGFFEVEEERMVILRLPEGASGGLHAGTVEKVRRRGVDVVASGKIDERVKNLLDRNRKHPDRSVVYALGLGSPEKNVEWVYNQRAQRMEVTRGILADVTVFVEGVGLL